MGKGRAAGWWQTPGRPSSASSAKITISARTRAPISRDLPRATRTAAYEMTPAATPAVIGYVNGVITTVGKSGTAVARSDRSTCRAFVIVMAPITTGAAAATSPGPAGRDEDCFARVVGSGPRLQ
ncbi:hypothetical protein GCM10020295_16870 [Streptomyces cinereospinus]